MKHKAMKVYVTNDWVWGRATWQRKPQVDVDLGMFVPGFAGKMYQPFTPYMPKSVLPRVRRGECVECELTLTPIKEDASNG